MKEINQKYLKSVLNSLPEVEPIKSSWEDLEKRLQFEDHLKITLPELKETMPSEELWNNINAELGNTTKVISLKQVITYATAIAATISLIIVVFLQISSSNEVQISYSQEIDNTLEIIPILSSSDLDKGAINFIDQICLQQTQLCQTTEFKVLKTQLEELTIEMQDLDEQLVQNDNNPYLIKARMKVENMHSDITKRLISIIIS
jgi:hypothetical protein